MTNNTSSVYKHINVCTRGSSNNNQLLQPVTIRIVAKDRDPINLRIKEAILIKDKKPNLNTREELSELALLVL
jgi:hypothetical protein